MKKKSSSKFPSNTMPVVRTVKTRAGIVNCRQLGPNTSALCNRIAFAGDMRAQVEHGDYLLPKSFFRFPTPHPSATNGIRALQDHLLGINYYSRRGAFVVDRIELLRKEGVDVPALEALVQKGVVTPMGIGDPPFSEHYQRTKLSVAEDRPPICPDCEGTGKSVNDSDTCGSCRGAGYLNQP